MAFLPPPAAYISQPSDPYGGVQALGLFQKSLESVLAFPHELGVELEYEQLSALVCLVQDFVPCPRHLFGVKTQPVVKLDVIGQRHGDLNDVGGGPRRAHLVGCRRWLVESVEDIEAAGCSARIGWRHQMPPDRSVAAVVEYTLWQRIQQFIGAA